MHPNYSYIDAVVDGAISDAYQYKVRFWPDDGSISVFYREVDGDVSTAWTTARFQECSAKELALVTKALNDLRGMLGMGEFNV